MSTDYVTALKEGVHQHANEQDTEELEDDTDSIFSDEDEEEVPDDSLAGEENYE